jgi:hypothetical protein
MRGNKQAYTAAYERAVRGKSTRTLAEWFMYPFEDVYTRQAREQAVQDAAANLPTNQPEGPSATA